MNDMYSDARKTVEWITYQKVYCKIGTRTIIANDVRYTDSSHGVEYEIFYDNGFRTSMYPLNRCEYPDLAKQP